MKESLHQGDIIRIENIKSPVLVASKDFFNQTGEIMNVRGFSKIDSIHMTDIINITDAIQGIFDYI